MPMVMRTVVDGQTCTLRKKAGKSFNCVILTVVQIVRSRYMIYTFGGDEQYKVWFLDYNVHTWTVQGEEIEITVTLCNKKGRGYNSAPQVGVGVDASVGIQWDKFEGSLRTGV